MKLELASKLLTVAIEQKNYRARVSAAGWVRGNTEGLFSLKAWAPTIARKAGAYKVSIKLLPINFLSPKLKPSVGNGKHAAGSPSALLVVPAGGDPTKYKLKVGVMPLSAGEGLGWQNREHK